MIPPSSPSLHYTKLNLPQLYHLSFHHQERGFSSPVVYESLRRNVMRALNESLADWHAQHPPPEPSLLHHRRRRLSSDKSEARRAKRRKDRATAWATLTGGRGSSKVTETTVHKSEERSEPYSSSALDGSSETRHSIDSGSRSSSSLSASSARSHARSDGPSSSATASTTTSSSRSSASTGGGVRGDVFVYVKIDGTEVTEARRAARRIGAGADSIGIVRKVRTCVHGGRGNNFYYESRSLFHCPFF
jgi:hypothetical protein